MNSQIGPILPKNRIHQIDILRGFALFGVLMVNMFGYNSSFFDFGGFYSQFTDSLNAGVFSFVVNYGADKFIGLFSLLFGVSFALMYSKFAENDSQFVIVYRRRLVVLMVFGWVHISLFWAGDILFSYSLLGFLLLLLRKTSSKILLLLSFIIYFLPIVYIAISVQFPNLPDALSSTSQLQMEEVKKMYTEGTISEVFKLRLHEYWSFRYINSIYYAPKILSLFLFGYFLQKHQFLRVINSHKMRFLALGMVLLFVGVLINKYTGQIVQYLAPGDENLFSTTIYMLIFEWANIFLIFSYLLLIATLSQLKWLAFLFRPFKYAGRMTLTNYLSYSVIFSTVMYSYGYGKFGSFTPLELIIIALAVFIIQLFVCKQWFRFFKWGPLEWVWRKLTYRF